ncbi:MAG: PLP-dependent transferase [Pseudomonadota bacterium]
MSEPLRLATLAARAGVKADPGHGGVIAPISVSSAYERADPSAPGAFDYARTAQPSRSLLEQTLASLEGAAGAVVTASGMAAIDLLLNDLPYGARIVAAHDCYGGTQRLFNARAAGGRFNIIYADCTDLYALENALAPGAALLFLETPSNPRLRITDIQASCVLGHAAGAIVAVDNTVLTPALQRPLSLGADLVVSSVTKMLNGHSDMVGGVLCARDTETIERHSWWANAAGVTGGAFDAFLALRGLRTLTVRARAQSAAAFEIAQRLARRSDVVRVDYPGLPTHPGHALAKAQQSGFGPLISFEPKGGPDRARAIVSGLELFTLAQSLGGTESLANIPALMTHASMSAEARQTAGVDDALIRLSVGLEDVEDLWSDLDAALSAGS